MKDYALVLAVGGAKGAYQIGAWRAMRELGADKLIGAVAGTSVGALNGALFVSGELKKANTLWESIEHEDILTPFKDEAHTERGGFLFSLINDINRVISIDKTGIFSRSGLSKIIKENLNFKAVRKSRLLLYITLFNRNTANAEYIKVTSKDSDEHIEKLLLASSAIPVVFGSEEIGGNSYYDGGLSDNCPVKPLYDAGFRKFIVVWLTHDVEFLLFENSVKFSDAEFVNIIPSEDQGNFLTGTLDFSSSGIAHRIELGYSDALRVLCDEFGGDVCTQKGLMQRLIIRRNIKTLQNQNKS